MRSRWSCARVVVFAASMIGVQPVLGERIDFLGPYVNGNLSEAAIAGQPFSLLARLSANDDIPLFGYSLNVDVTPKPDSMGMVVGNPTLSNFYLQQNLIVQGGGTLHPDLSIIIAPGDGGLFVNGVNILPVPVGLAKPGVSDILAELVFDTTTETRGFFEFHLGPGSVLSHVPMFELEFDAFPIQVEVIVPEPGGGLLLLAGMSVCSLARGARKKGVKAAIGQ